MATSKYMKTMHSSNASVSTVRRIAAAPHMRMMATAMRPCRSSCSAAAGSNGAPAPSAATTSVAVASKQHERTALALIKAALEGVLSPEEAAQQVATTMASAVADSMSSQGIDPAKQAAQTAEAFAAAETALKAEGRVPEVVFGAGKSPDQIAVMLQSIAERQRVALATRITPDMYAAVRKILPGLEYNARARLLTYRSPKADSLPRTERMPGTVAVVSAGSPDQEVAEECRLLTEHLGCFCFALPDLGLGNGLTRLLGSLSALRAADVVVVVCGLDGALASVVAGLVDAPVIAVPTSTGYGATLTGMAPLLAQLSCTTPGVTVVNIDNGFGAAMAAHKVLRMANRLHVTRSAQAAAAKPAANGSAAAK